MDSESSLRQEAGHSQTLAPVTTVQELNPYKEACHLPAPSGAEVALRKHPRQGGFRFVFSEDHQGLERVKSVADMGWEAGPQVGG